ncbi:MAG: hypothetical protein JWO07_844 [Candidatus Saccharibacteria bacterium]|nr:hypothetical protein [Candidatus Saccharibacteria bacterium]
MLNAIVSGVCALVALVLFIANPALPKMWQRAIAVVAIGITAPFAVLFFYAWHLPTAPQGDRAGMTIFIGGGLFLASWAIAKMTECGSVRTGRVARR